MVTTAIALHLRAKYRFVLNPRFRLLFSSSSSNSNEEPQDGPTSSQSQSQSNSSSSSSSASYFSDIRAKLRQQSPPQLQRKQPYPHQPFSVSSSGPSSPDTPKVAYLEEIRKNLSEFQRRASPSPSSDPISFQELYQRSLISKGGESIGEARTRGTMSYDAIRESLKKINKNRDGDRRTVGMSVSKFKESFSLKPADPIARGPSIMFGRTNNLPSSVFEKEMKEQKMVESSPPMKTEFMKRYTYDQLGDKLKKLRPDTKTENWFSLTELNERLVKLREMEQIQRESMVGGFLIQDVKESIQKIADGDRKKTLSVQRLDISSHLNETPSYMRKPPKEQLFEKYLHPDNMSSAELMKLELANVREEFKMSESDCGSARVQVAQLTTKIKHLSKVLHKKDKHSRKGLIEMVERRKKLLKYLRRTDWDSYCLVLSKLGLRDKPTEKGLIKR